MYSTRRVPTRGLTRRRVLATGLLLPLAARAVAEPGPLLVLAAASLGEVLEEVGRSYTRSSGGSVRFSFAASSVLARQIESGAAADVYFPADEEWMDYLARAGRIDAATRRALLGNRLALVAPADSRVRLTIGPHCPLLAALAGGRLAMAEPDTVPAGRYAHAALASLGVWTDVAGRVVAADNVRGALAFVARGEAPLGIVYATDARLEHRVRVVGMFPENSHPPIVYPVALVKGARREAATFLGFLEGPVAGAAFERFGFTVLH